MRDEASAAAPPRGPAAAAPPGAPAAAPLRVRLDRGRAALDAPDLDALCAATGTPVTAGPLWWRAAALAEPSWTPVLLRAERAGELVGVVPLAVRRRAGTTSVRLAGGAHADHAALPLLDDAAVPALVDALVDLLGRCRPWRLSLEQLPPHDPVVAALGRRLALRVGPGTPCPYVDLDHDGGLVAALSRNGKRNRRNSVNRLAADGRVVEHTWSGGDAALALLGQVQELRRRRDHALGRSSELDAGPGRAWHTATARELARRGALRLLTTRVDGVLAAYVLLAADGDVLRVWCGRVAPGYERYGLGWLTHCAVLEHALQDRAVARLDWLRGDQESKQRSATGATAPVVVHAESGAWVAALDRAGRRTAERLLDVARRRVPPDSRARWRARLGR